MVKLLSACFLLISFQGISQQFPYPKSEHIKSIEWEDNSKIQHAPGSDQWPLTWADDDHLYAAWGDGHGWNHEKGENKISLGVTRISGNPPQLSGTDTWGVGPGSSFGKPDALVAFDNKLFMFWTNGDSRFDHDSYPAVSSDKGLTWDLGAERVFKYAPVGFRVRGICQYGRGYEGAIDDYLYVYFGLNRHPDIYLARVKMENIFNSEEYEWYMYRNPDGSASWSPDFGKKTVVFQDNNAFLWHLGIGYNPSLDRFLLTKPHFKNTDNRDHVLADITSLGIFDAPSPWGPWTTVYYQDNFIDEYVKFNYFIPNKFLGEDGESFWLGWSGWPEYDNVNFIKGRFVLP